MIFGLLLYLFFFKQKTAYEMRISDWSSDVCSSDLRGRPSPHKHIRLTQLRDDLFRRKTLTSHNFLQFFRHNRLSLELDQFFQGRPNHADMDIIGTVPFYQLPQSGPAEGVSPPPPRARKRRTRTAAIVALDKARAVSARA